MTLSNVTIFGQSGPGSDGNKGIFCISESSSITGVSPSDGLMSYAGCSLGGGGGLTSLQKYSLGIIPP